MDMIVAHDNAYAIGKNNQLAWDVPEDMRHFVIKSTSYGVLVMGRNTLDSIGRALPGREIHCLSSWGESKFGEFRYSNVNELLNNIPDGALVVGGSAIYEMFIDTIEVLWVTVIETCIEDADAFFPDYKNTFNLECVLEKGISEGDEGLSYRIEKWVRK
jgi:dihydrofolate reductase